VSPAGAVFDRRRAFPDCNQPIAVEQSGAEEARRLSESTALTGSIATLIMLGAHRGWRISRAVVRTRRVGSVSVTSIWFTRT
jgi:hypothetical protein